MTRRLVIARLYADQRRESVVAGHRREQKTTYLKWPYLQERVDATHSGRAHTSSSFRGKQLVELFQNSFFARPFVHTGYTSVGIDCTSERQDGS